MAYTDKLSLEDILLDKTQSCGRDAEIVAPDACKEQHPGRRLCTEKHLYAK
jgi:hypothetical protein